MCDMKYIIYYPITIIAYQIYYNVIIVTIKIWMIVEPQNTKNTKLAYKVSLLTDFPLWNASKYPTKTYRYNIIFIKMIIYTHGEIPISQIFISLQYWKFHCNNQYVNKTYCTSLLIKCAQQPLDCYLNSYKLIIIILDENIWYTLNSLIPTVCWGKRRVSLPF